MKKLAAMLAVLASTGLIACGGGDDSTSTSSSTTTSAATTTTTASKPKLPLLDDHIQDEHVRYAADPSGRPAYFVSEASASSGKATLQFVNPQSIPHNVVVEGPNGKSLAETKTIGEGKTSTGIDLKPGVYVVYCSVPGHRAAGMVGHLTVVPK